jgi:hypothetical protein
MDGGLRDELAVQNRTHFYTQGVGKLCLFSNVADLIWAVS